MKEPKLPSIVRGTFIFGIALATLTMVIIFVSGAIAIVEDNSALRTMISVSFLISLICIIVGIAYEHKNQKPF